MEEALQLWDDLINYKAFKTTSIILFLTKRDEFAMKIKKVPLTICFPEYKGDNSYNDASGYIRTQFEARNRQSTKQIFTRITSVDDTDNAGHIKRSLFAIFFQSLKEQNLLV